MRYLSTLAIFLCVAQTVAAQAQSGFRINCAIKPSQEIQLSASTPGVVAEVLVRPGQTVAAQDVIAKLDTDLAQSDLKLAQQQAQFDGAVRAAAAQVSNLEKRVDLLQTALTKRAISESEVDAATLELALAEVSLERQQQEQQLAKLRAERAALLVEKGTIRSPVSGTIGEDLISEGETATVPIATIYVTSLMRVEAFVPTQFVDQLVQAKTAKIVVNGNDAAPLEVAFDYGSPMANLSSNTISLFYTLEDTRVLPGSKCQIIP